MGTHDRIRSHERHHRDRQIEETVHDPYRERCKPAGTAFCPHCGAVFHDGRWQWMQKPAEAAAHDCPACRRIHEDFPAGYVVVSGAFATEHADEIRGLVSNEEARAKAEHPLERVMHTRMEDGKTVITTTGTHLARRIGEALHNAWKGKLEIRHAQDEHMVRVWWER